MSDSQEPLVMRGGEALAHLAAWAEHMMQGLASLGAMHPMGLPPSLSSALAGARVRLDAAKLALESAANAVGDVEKGDVTAAEGDLTNAGAEVGSAFHGSESAASGGAGEVVSGGSVAPAGPTQ